MQYCWSSCLCPASIKARISVQMSPEILLVESRQIHKRDFESVLQAIIEQKMSTGIRREELTIDLKVDGSTKRGDVADIEMSLRRLNVKKITYSTF